MKSFEISNVETKQGLMTQILVGEASGELPRHLMLGTKENGYVVEHGTIRQHFHENIFDRGGKRYITIKEADVQPFSDLFNGRRPDVLHQLRRLAQAILLLPAQFLQTQNGFIEAWRIFFLGDDSFLFLPKTVSDIIAVTVDDSFRFEWYGQFVKSQVEVPFAMCHQFTQFLYMAYCGKAPYAERAVREDSWRHLPLALVKCGLPPEASRWIDETLAMPVRLQREHTSGAYGTSQNLSWWISETEALVTSAPQSTLGQTSIIATTAQAEAFLVAQQKRAGRRLFWRKRGALIVTLTLVVAVVLYTVIGIVADKLKPPYTAGMDPVEIIAEYFASQNALDAERMGSSLARGVKNPFENEVTTLFVNSKVRMAYEGLNTVVRADQWLASNKASIPDSSMVYGIGDLQIRATGPDVYRADFRYFYPSRNPDAPEDPTFNADGSGADAGTWVSESKMSIEFEFSDQKGYWQITAIREIETIPVATYEVETHPVKQTMMPIGL